jgi:hypothetical protein
MQAPAKDGQDERFEPTCTLHQIWVRCPTIGAPVRSAHHHVQVAQITVFRPFRRHPTGSITSNEDFRECLIFWFPPCPQRSRIGSFCQEHPTRRARRPGAGREVIDNWLQRLAENPRGGGSFPPSVMSSSSMSWQSA